MAGMTMGVGEDGGGVAGGVGPSCFADGGVAGGLGPRCFADGGVAGGLGPRCFADGGFAGGVGTSCFADGVGLLLARRGVCTGCFGFGFAAI
jgi:hypothetical protein